MKNILIPTDLTAGTNNTVRYAINLGIKSKTKLFFYHVAEKKEFANKEYLENYIMKTFPELTNLSANLQIEFISELDNFSNQKIINQSVDHSIDLIVIGASHHGLRTTFFGSHVSELINDLKCPVLTIPHNYNCFDLESIGYSTALYDLGIRIKEIIPFARLFDAKIRIFHVYPVFPQEVDIKKYNVEKELFQIKSQNNYDKIELLFIKTTFDNEPVTGIREFINIYKPDMLVMCHKPRGLFDKFVLDSGATLSVVKSSPVPVLALTQKSACRIM